MSRKINYPVKYAVLELKENGGYVYNYSNIIQGYIVSKCYVIESKVTYNYDGEGVVSYEVIFPYENITDFKRTLRYNNKSIVKETMPRTSAVGNIWQTEIVTELFDTYEEAKEFANGKNEKHKLGIELGLYPYNKIIELSNDDELKKYKEYIIKDFERNLDICNLFEKLITNNTIDMVVCKDIKDKKYVKVLRPSKK